MQRGLFAGALAALTSGVLAVPARAEPVNAVSFEQGAVLRSYTSEYGGRATPQWIALALIDGDPATGWASANGALPPHEFLFELRQTYRLESFGFDNVGTEESGYPGVSARDIVIAVSTAGPEGPFEVIVSGSIAPAAMSEIALDAPVEARWLKLTVAGNGGRDDYSELMEFSAIGEAVSERPADQSISGTYATNWGAFYVVVAEGGIRGCYDHDDGRFSGSSAGGFLNIAWTETGDQVGNAVLAITEDGSYLSGFWYEGGVRRGTWAGPATDDTAQPQCAQELIGATRSAVEQSLDESGAATLYGIYFDFDSAALQPRSEPVLQQLVRWFNANLDARAVFEGHTDSTGAEDYNQTLSADRANSVIAWLIASGIDPGRLSATGLGESSPVADNDTPAGQALNRRVEVRIQ